MVVMVGVTQLCTWVFGGKLMVGDWFVGNSGRIWAIGVNAGSGGELEFG